MDRHERPCDHEQNATGRVPRVCRPLRRLQGMFFGNSVTGASEKNRVGSLFHGRFGGNRHCPYRSIVAHTNGEAVRGQAIPSDSFNTIFMSSAVPVCITCACLEVAFSVHSQLFAAANLASWKARSNTCTNILLLYQYVLQCTRFILW